MARGGYTFSDIRQMSQNEIEFISYHQERVELDFIDKLSVILGVTWDLEAYARAKKAINPNEKQKTLVIPLSAAINMKILDYVDKQAGTSGVVGTKAPYIGGGEYQPKEGEVIASVESMDKDTFLGLIGRPKPKR